MPWLLIERDPPGSQAKRARRRPGRMLLIVVVTAVALLTSACAVRSAASEPATTATALDHQVLDPPGAHHVAALAARAGRWSLASQLATARLATARYATDLQAARSDGYQIITRMIPDMGYHFLNPAIQGFDVRKPPILVYVRHGRTWQLVALEWVFPQQPEVPLLPGATYGSFDAACHYKDGTFVFASSQDRCAKRSPQSGAAFKFWHPDLVTLHVWLWYPNPAGLYNGTNPLIRPFNRG
jgi:hypothetical protein